ncbi:MAG: hypothetical protein ACKVU0_03050 [Saprospiraceae bacterium]
MTGIILFDWFHLGLSGEWVSAAIGIAITYAVFIMGVPALIFQTFIPEALRNMYNKRLMRRSHQIFTIQILLILILLWIVNPKVGGLEGYGPANDALAYVIYGMTFLILLIGHAHLIWKFRTSQHIGKQLSKKIADSVLSHFKEKKEIKNEDLEDLALLAVELPNGSIKNAFLDCIGQLIEDILSVADSKPEAINKAIGDIVEKTVDPSVTSSLEKTNAENMKKALEVLSFAFNQGQRRIGNGEDKSYFKTIISSSIKEIGVCAVIRKDLATVMNAIEKLSQIDGVSRDVYTLGDSALQEGYMQASVVASRKLGDRVRKVIAAREPDWVEDKRVCAWLGLVARIYQKSGHAHRYAETQIEVVLEQPHVQQDDIQLTFKNAQNYFYRRLADFSTADAILELQQKRYPALT